MVTTAYTYTNGNGLPIGQSRPFVRLSDGTAIFGYVEGGTTDDIIFRYSTNPSSSWSDVTGTITDHYTVSYGYWSWFVDADDQIHLVHWDAGNELTYHRGTFSSGTITWGVNTSFSTYSSPMQRTGGVVAFKQGTDDHIWFTASNSSQGYVWHIKCTSGGTATVENYYSAAPSSSAYNQIDFEHTGDGVTPTSTPHVWVAAATPTDKLSTIKFTWSSGPSWSQGSTQTYGTAYGPDDSYPIFTSFWDGTRFVSVYSSFVPTYTYITERDASDTTFTTYTSSPTLQNNYTSAAYDPATGDIWAFKLDSGTDLNYCKWDRSADSWDASWTEVEAGTVGSVHTAPRHTPNYDNIEVIWEDSVLTAVRWAEIVSLNTAPSQPTWNNTDNDVEDVAETLLLDWNFVDVNSGDTQSKYKLQRNTGNNVLPADDTDIESTIGRWVAYEGCTISRSSAQARSGSWSMLVDVTGGTTWRVGPVASGNYGATVTAAEVLQYGIPWTGGVSVQRMFSVYGVGHTNSVSLYLDQYDADGDYITGNAVSTSCTNGSWKDTGSGNYTSTNESTAFVIPIFYGSSGYAAGEDVYIDNVQVGFGDSMTLTSWEGPSELWYNGSTWTTEQWVTSSTESVTLAASWASDSDDPHIFFVWTNDGTADSEAKSLPLRVIPSAQDNPTIDSFTTITGQSESITWTVTTQTKKHVRVYRNVGLTDLEYDSGVLVSGTKSHTTPFTEEGTRYVWVQTWNDEGLASDVDTEQVEVDWLDPNYPVPTVTEDTPAGAITVAWSNP